MFRRRPNPARIAAMAGLVLAAGAMAPVPGAADCAPSGGVTVTCSGADTDGFDGTGAAVALTVENGATVSNAAGDVIVLDGASQVTIEGSGTVLATQDGSNAIAIGSPATIDLFGVIDVMANSATAISATTGSLTTSFQGSRIEIAGDDGIGIAAGAGSAIDHGGLIGITGDRGIGVLAGDDLGSILNQGRIQIDGVDGIGIDAGDRNTVSNIGTIEVNDIVTMSGIGVRVGQDSLISNAALAVIEAETAIVLDGSGTSVLNAGVLRGTTAIQSASGGHTIVNTGDIIGDVLLGAGDDVFFNAGLLQATSVNLGGGDDIMELDAEGTRFFIMPPAFDGGSETTEDRFVLSGVGPSGLRLGFLTDFEVLDVAGGEWTLRETGSFSGGATVRSGATVQINGPSFGDTTLNGDLTFEDGSTLEILIDPDGANGQLIVNGDVAQTGGLEFLLTQPAGPRVPIQPSQTLSLLSANSIDLPSISDTAVLDFAVVPGAIGSDLLVSRGSTYAGVGLSRNQQAVGGHLDRVLVSNPTTAVNNLLWDLDQLSPEAARIALDSLGAEAYDAHTSQNLALGFALADVIGRNRARCDREYRFTMRGRGTRQSNPCGSTGRGAWADVLVSFANRDSPFGHIDYDTSTTAAVFGTDFDVSDWVVSGFVGASTASIDVDSVGDGEAETIESGAMLRRAFGNFQLRTLVSYAYGWNRQTHSILLGPARPRSKADFTSQRFISHTAGEYVVEVAGAEVAPIAHLEYAYLREGSFDETGGGPYALSVRSRTTSYLRSGIGARVAYEGLKYYWMGRFLAWTDGTWRGELRGRWLRTWVGDQRNLYASFRRSPSTTTPFRSQGQDVEEAAEFGTRITFQPLLYQAAISVGYDFQFGDGTRAHRGTADVRIPF